MPKSRDTETPYSLDELPRPNLLLGDIQQLSKELESAGNRDVTEKSSTKEMATQAPESNRVLDDKMVVDISNDAVKSKALDTSTVVVKSRTVGYLKTVANCGTQKTGKATTSELRHPVTVSQDSEKPTIVTNKKPFDDSTCRRSPPLWTTLTTNTSSDAERRLPDIQLTRDPSNNTASSAKNASTVVTNSSNLTKRSPSLTTKSTPSLPQSSSSSSTNPTRSTSNSPRTSSNTPGSTMSSPSSSTNPSRSTTNSSSSTTNSPSSSSTRSGSRRNISDRQQAKRTRRRQNKQSSHTCLSEDVDNYMGNKAIDELLKYIEG